MVIDFKKRRRLRISDNLMIYRIVLSYGTDFQKVQNRFLYGWDHSENKAVLVGSEYMEGIEMVIGKELESFRYLFSTELEKCSPERGKINRQIVAPAYFKLP